MRPELTETETIYNGPIFSVSKKSFTYPDQHQVTLDVVEHADAVAVVAADDQFVYLLRQPRMAANEPDLLELPAGLLDHPDESPLSAAKRELAEELNLAAADWQQVSCFYLSPGFCDEKITLFYATDLSYQFAEADEDERITAVKTPLSDVESLLEQITDSKTLIGLLWLQRNVLDR